MQKVAAFDFETTKFPDAVPWQTRARPVTLHIFDGSKPITYTDFNNIDLSEYDVLIAANAKFDMHWLQALSISYKEEAIYCTQVAEYIIRGSDNMINYDLATCCKRYKITDKIDRVKPYWDSGIDTPDIPKKILIPYGEQDAVNAYLLWQAQQPIINKYGLEKSIKLEMRTISCLCDIESNGMLVDVQLFKDRSAANKKRIQTIELDLNDAVGYNVLWSSSDQVSAALFGGTINEKYVETYWKELKSGKKKATRNAIREIKLDGIFKPEPEWETKKPGVYQTNKDILVQIKAKGKKQKAVLQLLLEYSKLSQENKTYYGNWEHDVCLKGWPSFIRDDGLIHGNMNQTIATTGRLTSSQPNQQNLPREKGGVKNGIISRYSVCN